MAVCHTTGLAVHEATKQNFNNNPQNKLQINNMFNSGTSESCSNPSDGILTNILQQLNTNLFPDQSANEPNKDISKKKSSLVDLATISLPNTGISESVESSSAQNSSIWSFPQNQPQKK